MYNLLYFSSNFFLSYTKHRRDCRDFLHQNSKKMFVEKERGGEIGCKMWKITYYLLAGTKSVYR